MYPPNIVEMLKSSKCPLWQKTCDKVCPSCKWFKKVSGKNPNTGRDVEDWDCAVSWMPLFQMDATLAARSGAAATESARNESMEQNKELIRQSEASAVAIKAMLELAHNPQQHSDEARAQQRLIKAHPVHLIEGSQG